VNLSLPIASEVDPHGEVIPWKIDVEGLAATRAGERHVALLLDRTGCAGHGVELVKLPEQMNAAVSGGPGS
jgi:hypothetical protein